MKSCIYAVALLAAFPVSAVSATLFSDNFDGETAGFNASLSNWTISDGTIDLISNAGGLSVDLDGSTQNGGTIISNQSFTFSGGTLYTLAFDYDTNPFGTPDFNTANFGITNGLFFDTITVLDADNPPSLVPFSVDFFATGTGNIFFEQFGGDNGGIVIDNVTLSSQAVDGVGDVPLPMSGLLLMSGFGVLAALQQSRKPRQS